MRRTFILPLLALAAACAPRPGGAVLAPRPATGDVLLAGGPEGESPVPTGPLPSAPATAPRTPALATAVMVPSARLSKAVGRLRDKELVIPVVGVEASKLEDSFTAARDGDRQHNALDILAPRNTAIVAADDGVILRMSSNKLGGITIYAADKKQEFVYYYAHLERYKDGLEAGSSIKKGDTIGYVGTSGNAPEDIPHLHFQVMLWPSDGKWWDGEPVNPFPALRGATTSGGGRPRFD